jgi:Protein of unknown function (DUF3298)/Deacetylase PdaC
MKLVQLSLLVLILGIFTTYAQTPLKYTTETKEKGYEDPESGIASEIMYSYVVFEKNAVGSWLNTFIKDSIFKGVDFDLEMNQFIADFKEELVSNVFLSSEGFEKKISCQVLYQKGKLMLLGYEEYAFTGGAHPNTIFQNYIVDLTQKKHIKVNNLWAPDKIQELQNHLEKYLREQWKIPVGMKLSDYGFVTVNEKLPLSKNINFTKDSLVFCYNTYEIAPYSMGIVEIKIPMYVIKDILNKDSVIHEFFK